jgi:hypothetical protein
MTTRPTALRWLLFFLACLPALAVEGIMAFPTDSPVWRGGGSVYDHARLVLALWSGIGWSVLIVEWLNAKSVPDDVLHIHGATNFDPCHQNAATVPPHTKVAFSRATGVRKSLMFVVARVALGVTLVACCFVCSLIQFVASANERATNTNLVAQGITDKAAARERLAIDYATKALAAKERRTSEHIQSIIAATDTKAETLLKRLANERLAAIDRERLERLSSDEYEAASAMRKQAVASASKVAGVLMQLLSLSDPGRAEFAFTLLVYAGCWLLAIMWCEAMRGAVLEVGPRMRFAVDIEHQVPAAVHASAPAAALPPPMDYFGRFVSADASHFITHESVLLACFHRPTPHMLNGRDRVCADIKAAAIAAGGRSNRFRQQRGYSGVAHVPPATKI